jgi:enediyne biosynthesis protein E4
MKKSTFLKLGLILLPIFALEMSSQYGYINDFLGHPFAEARVTRDDFQIVDITASSGVSFVHQVIPKEYMLKEVSHIDTWMLGSGGGLAIVDYDNDGLSDIYATTMTANSQNKMFRNLGNEKFEDVTAKIIEPSNTDYISFKPVFFDCDNDGDKDLFLTTSSCPRLYRNDSGHFTNITKDAGEIACVGPTTNVVDLNNDGLLDIINGTYRMYGAADMPDNLFKASTGKQQVSISKNLGACRFSTVTIPGIDQPGYTLSVGITDLRDLHRKDIWLASDYGPDHLYLDNGDGTYTNSSNLLEHSYQRHGMAFDVTYKKNERRPLVYVSHIHEPGLNIEGNALWKWNDGANLINTAIDQGVNRCGHAWGGKFFDANHDGNEDLIVTNGFRSANKAKKYNFNMALLSTTARTYLPYAKHWPAFGDASMFGYEKNCLYISTGDRFAKLAEQNDLVKDDLDGRAVATIDLTNNGTESLVVANHRQELRVFKVTADSKNHWIGFKLEGRCSNRDALGTEVDLEFADGSTQRKYYYPTNGFFAQSHEALVFGIGDQKNHVVAAHVRWPRGLVQRVETPAVDTYIKLQEDQSCESL